MSTYTDNYVNPLEMDVWSLDLKFSNVVIPFDNTIEKGTDLYNLYNTNLHEKFAMKKEKNRVDNGGRFSVDCR